MEFAGLGIFMISAGSFGTLLFYPDSPILRWMPDPSARFFVMGLAMGLTAVGIVYSPWGRQSGAHINPAVTLTFFFLGKIEPPDAVFYVIAQFLGGLAGVLLVSSVFGHSFALPPVSYVVTVPGDAGVPAAFLAEAVISFLLMLMVLFTTNTSQLSRFTGLFVGAMLVIYITLESPLSGMSMNPARTFASALPARIWTALWVYFTAPTIGMLSASFVYLRLKGKDSVGCAKLNHHTTRRCIFHCDYRKPKGRSGDVTTAR